MPGGAQLISRRLLPAAAAIAGLALSSAGCGGSSSHSTSSATVAQTQTGASAPAVVTTTPPVKRPPATPPRQTHSTKPATTSGHGGTSPSAARSGSQGPDGLRASAGYATYELCSPGCAGAVPASLRRALRKPSLATGSSCRSRHVKGPVLPSSAGTLTIRRFTGSAWPGARVSWVAPASYQGPVLIRGRQVGGPHAVGFGVGHVPYDELQLNVPGAATPRGSGREWPSFTRVRGAGCYFYQVDGTSFSETILFRAAG